VDEALAGAAPHEWAARLTAERRFRNSEVIREVLRRAERAYENPVIEGGWTAAAVALCDALVAEGTPPPIELRIQALKERAMALRSANDLKGALRTLERALELSAEMENREQWDAIISRCARQSRTRKMISHSSTMHSRWLMRHRRCSSDLVMGGAR